MERTTSQTHRLSVDGDVFPRIPGWCIIGLFIFTVNNSRYIAVGYGHHGESDVEKLIFAARMGGLIAVASGGGALLWSLVFDHFESHKVCVMFVQGIAVASACAAAVMSILESFISDKVSFLVFVCLFTSMGICPIRDAITSKQVLEAEKRRVPTPSVGCYRMFLAVGQGFIAILSTNAMIFGECGVLLVKASFMLTALLLYGACFPDATVRFFLQKPVPKPSQQSSTAPVKTHKAQVSLLFFACLCLGMANSFVEILFYPVLRLRGFYLPLLGLAHCVALAAECPLFYFERLWVHRIGGYATSFFCASLAMAGRLAIIAGLIILEVPPSPLLTLVVFLCESLHGVSRVPATLSAARFAAELAPPGQVTTLNAILSMAIGSFGQAAGLGCFILMHGDVERMLLLCFAEALAGAMLISIVGMLHPPPAKY